MNITAKDEALLAQRNRLSRRWPWVGGALMAAIGCVVAYLFAFSPLLVNPWRVMDLIEADRIPQAKLAEMAAKLPIVFLLCCVLLVALVLFQIAAAVNERRLLAVVDKLHGTQEPE